MIKDILRLKYQGGLSHERIARSLSVSKGVVAKYLGLASAAGLRAHSRLADLTPDEHYFAKLTTVAVAA